MLFKMHLNVQCGERGKEVKTDMHLFGVWEGKYTDCGDRRAATKPSSYGRQMPILRPTPKLLAYGERCPLSPSTAFPSTQKQINS